MNIGTHWLLNALASLCILQPTRANIHQYQFNNPIIFIMWTPDSDKYYFLFITLLVLYPNENFTDFAVITLPISLCCRIHTVPWDVVLKTHIPNLNWIIEECILCAMYHCHVVFCLLFAILAGSFVHYVFFITCSFNRSNEIKFNYRFVLVTFQTILSCLLTCNKMICYGKLNAEITALYRIFS